MFTAASTPDSSPFLFSTSFPSNFQLDDRTTQSDHEGVSSHAGITASSSERTPEDEGIAFSDEFCGGETQGKVQFTERVPGRLKAFIAHWRRAQAPAWILDIIEQGFLLPFKDGILPPKYQNY